MAEPDILCAEVPAWQEMGAGGQAGGVLFAKSGTVGWEHRQQCHSHFVGLSAELTGLRPKVGGTPEL